MSLVRFCSKCDHCGGRSAEYTEHAICRNCITHCCKACQAPNTLEGGNGEPESCLCAACAKVAA